MEEDRSFSVADGYHNLTMSQEDRPWTPGWIEYDQLGDVLTLNKINFTQVTSVTVKGRSTGTPAEVLSATLC